MNQDTIIAAFGLASVTLFTFGFVYQSLIENGTIQEGRKPISLSEIEKEVQQQLIREASETPSKTNTSCNKPAPPSLDLNHQKKTSSPCLNYDKM